MTSLKVNVRWFKGEISMSDARYPVGKFTPDEHPTPETRAKHIQELASLPTQMRQAVGGLTPEQLDTPYREGGWTVRQVVHHVPDSHLNAYIRFKLALTEEHPTIKAYDENVWANLDDARSAPINVSLDLLEALHLRWVLFLRSLKGGDFQRTFNH